MPTSTRYLSLFVGQLAALPERFLLPLGLGGGCGGVHAVVTRLLFAQVRLPLLLLTLATHLQRALLPLLTLPGTGADTLDSCDMWEECGP